jgi:DNA-3-methyladenine glycosylase I
MMPEAVRTYCQSVALMDPKSVHRAYHDNEYGFPIQEDNALFGRLLLEINQAGLSWTTILKKKANFHQAYAGFDVDQIARFSESDRIRLMQDAGIIRNRLKIEAAIHNARVIQGLQKSHGSFKAWLDHHHPLPRERWVKLFRKTFKFTGGEITHEFLQSTGYLPGAHDSSCPIYARVMAQHPKWNSD